MIGIWWALGSVLLSAVCGVLIKLLTGQYPVVEVIFFRFVIGSLSLMPLLMYHGPAVMRTRQPSLHLARGLLTFCAIMATFSAISMLPLAEFTILSFAGPPIMAALSWPLLGDRPERLAVVAVLLGFAGVVLAFAANAGSGLLTLGACLALLSALLETLSNAGAKVIAREDGAATSVIWFSVVNAGLASLAVPFVWVPPDPGDIVRFLALGVAANAAQWCMVKAMARSTALGVSNLNYLQIPLMALLDFIVFATAPDTHLYPAAALILISGLMVGWNARRSSAQP